MKSIGPPCSYHLAPDLNKRAPKLNSNLIYWAKIVRYCISWDVCIFLWASGGSFMPVLARFAVPHWFLQLQFTRGIDLQLLVIQLVNTQIYPKVSFSLRIEGQSSNCVSSNKILASRLFLKWTNEVLLWFLKSALKLREDWENLYSLRRICMLR
jgi:hypothetical protein